VIPRAAHDRARTDLAVLSMIARSITRRPMPYVM
jgi:hypothetical protein